MAALTTQPEIVDGPARRSKDPDHLPGRINAVDLKTLLAKSKPIVVIFMADGSHFARERLTAFTLWHPDAVSGSHPPHLLLDEQQKHMLALSLFRF